MEFGLDAASVFGYRSDVAAVLFRRSRRRRVRRENGRYFRESEERNASLEIEKKR